MNFKSLSGRSSCFELTGEIDKLFSMGFTSLIDSIPVLSNEIMIIETKSKTPRQDLLMLCADQISTAANGDLLVPHYMPNCKAEQEFFFYNGKHWDILEYQEVLDVVRDCCYKMGNNKGDVNVPRFVKSLIEILALRVSRQFNPQMPQDTTKINLNNGTLVVSTEVGVHLEPFSREDGFFYCLPYDYDPTATCPLWQRFLDEVLPEKDKQMLLQEFFAYCFTKNLKMEKMLVLLGSGANGKSVVLDTAEKLFGRQNVSSVPISSLCYEENPRLMIEHKLLNISRENKTKFDEQTFKTLISGEPVLVKKLFKDFREIRDYAKLMAAYNQMPEAENTHGFFRRILILPFNVTIQPEKQDIDLSKKLEVEISGILNWVLEGLVRLCQNKAFTRCEAGELAKKKYMTSSDTVMLYTVECCEKDSKNHISGNELYHDYKNYCIDSGERYLGKQKFYDRLKVLGYERIEYRHTAAFNLKIVKADETDS